MESFLLLPFFVAWGNLELFHCLLKVLLNVCGPGKLLLVIPVEFFLRLCHGTLMTDTPRVREEGPFT